MLIATEQGKILDKYKSSRTAKENNKYLQDLEQKLY